MSWNRLHTVRIPSAAFFCLAIAAGCNGNRTLYPPKINAAAAASRAMAMYDANKDGKMSDNEFDQCSALKVIAKNGVVTPDLIESQCQKWTASGIGRVPGSIRILRNGQPLLGASVKLVPEKFLGNDFKPTAGVTETGGVVAVSVATTYPGEPKGVSVGFYRIEVTKEGENIPAKYNTETALSLAVTGEVLDGATFNLVY